MRGNVGIEDKRRYTLIKSDKYPSSHQVGSAQLHWWQPPPVSGSGSLLLAPGELGQGNMGLQLLADVTCD